MIKFFYKKGITLVELIVVVAGVVRGFVPAPESNELCPQQAKPARNPGMGRERSAQDLARASASAHHDRGREAARAPTLAGNHVGRVAVEEVQGAGGRDAERRDADQEVANDQRQQRRGHAGGKGAADAQPAAQVAPEPPQQHRCDRRHE